MSSNTHTQMGHVYYHHPGDKQFSLDFVHPDPDEIVSQIVGYGDDAAVKVQKYDIDKTFYVIYTSRVGGGPVQEIDFNLNESLSEMSADNSTIVVRLLEIYRALIAQNEEEEGTPVEAYKNIDVDALPDVLDRTSWEGSATDVAGRLASNLILKRASECQPSNCCCIGSVLPPASKSGFRYARNLRRDRSRILRLAGMGKRVHQRIEATVDRSTEERPLQAPV